jgi:hypothetical protein
VVAVADFGFARVRKKRGGAGEGGGQQGSDGADYPQFSATRIGPVRWEAPETLRLRKVREREGGRERERERERR